MQRADAVHEPLVRAELQDLRGAVRQARHPEVQPRVLRIKRIEAREELTFDYTDRDEEDEEPNDYAEVCCCRAAKCCGWVWFGLLGAMHRIAVSFVRTSRPLPVTPG